MPNLADRVHTARIIQVKISPQHQFGDKATRADFVKPEPVPEDKVAVADFVHSLFPKQPIEHLGRVEMIDANAGEGYGGHSLFFQAVHGCFNRHYPLALRPEVLSYLINHEVAVTVNQHPEDYRHLFTSSQKKEIIRVRDRSLRRGIPASNWARTLGLFEHALPERVPVGCMELLLPKFSTHTPESRAATLVAFMDAARSYYDYRVRTLCGIPEIRLDGAPEDYETLVHAARQLREIFSQHLGDYFTHLLPVLETIADQAAGAPLDNDFWSRIYQHDSESGKETSSGWITAFLAYTRNLHGELKRKEPGGIPTGAFPTHVSSVPFLWEYRVELRVLPMTFIGGVLAVENSDGFVCPRLSYGVLEGFADHTPRPVPRLMIVESSVIADPLASILSYFGYECATAYDGFEAVQKARQFMPQFILMGVVMPRMNGTEAAQLVLREQPDCKVTFIAGSTGAESLVNEFKERGYPCDVLQQPLDFLKLFDKLNELGFEPPIDPGIWPWSNKRES